MMWSSVPNVRSGMRTLSFSSFSIWKACGVVTSWMRCRPIRSWVWPDGSVRTVCASHTLSSSVRAMKILRPRIVPHRGQGVQRRNRRRKTDTLGPMGTFFVEAKLAAPDEGRTLHTVCLFGDAGDLDVLGAYTLEGFGLGVDPVQTLDVAAILRHIRG